MTYSVVPAIGGSDFRQVVDSAGFPAFIANFLKGLYDANLEVQHMDQHGAELTSKGFAQLGQASGPFLPGDVALFGSRIAIYVGGVWVSGGHDPSGLRPPYRIYRYCHLTRRR